MENLVNDRAMSFDGGRPPHPYAIDCTDAVVDGALDARTRPSSGLSDKALERTTAYIREHLFDSLSLGDLARIACVSRFHFARMFRARTGFSPMKYVQNERIRTAKQLLRRGEGNISSIAAALGFFDQSHFSRVFRKVTGISPGRYAQGHARDADPA